LNFDCQADALLSLRNLADSDAHSIILCGMLSCGKTHLAWRYSDLVHTDNFISVPSKMTDIKSIVDDCSSLNTSVTICFENIDTGVLGVSNALLKLLEEPPKNVYIVITCKNISNVLSTVVSRCIVVSVMNPTQKDLLTYASKIHFSMNTDSDMWNSLYDFSDIDIISKLTQDQILYFESCLKTVYSKDPIIVKLWKIQKFPDGNPVPTKLLIQYIMHMSKSSVVSNCGRSCIHDIMSGKIASHAALAKFLLDCSMI